MKPETLNHYGQRLEPVLRWLASHPDADPDLYRLADLACLSPYHFHRVYRALMGETVNATVQRIRMHRAAVALGRSEASCARWRSAPAMSRTRRSTGHSARPSAFRRGATGPPAPVPSTHRS